MLEILALLLLVEHLEDVSALLALLLHHVVFAFRIVWAYLPSNAVFPGNRPEVLRLLWLEPVVRVVAHLDLLLLVDVWNGLLASVERKLNARCVLLYLVRHGFDHFFDVLRVGNYRDASEARVAKHLLVVDWHAHEFELENLSSVFLRTEVQQIP